jgi:hypothetical protein
VRIAVSSSVMKVLEDAGWSERRRAGIRYVRQALDASGFAVDEQQAAVLASFVGLSVSLPAFPTMRINFLNEDSLIVDPVGVGTRNIAEARDLLTRFSSNFCPFGWWLCRSHVYFSSSGLTVAVLPGVLWRLGSSFDEALEFMILAHRPLEQLATS